MTATNTSCEVSIPSNRFINKIRKTVGLGSCKNLYTDDIIRTTLKDCNMDQTRTCQILTMIHDVRAVVDIKNSVDDVCTMLKECNMDPSEATQRLLYLDTFQEVKKEKDTPKNVSDGDTVQEVEQKKDAPKSGNSDTVQEVEKKKYTQKSVSNGDTVQEVEKKKDTQKSVSNGDTVQEVQTKKDTQKSVGKWDNQWRGTSRGNFYPSKVYNDAGRRNLTSGKEYGVTNNHVKKVWRPTTPVDSTNIPMTIPSQRFVHRIKMTVGLARCKNRLNDDIIYTTLKDFNMDQTETCRMLTMIHDVREVSSSYSVDEVYTMLKECNMDQTETCRRLKMIQDIRVVASEYSVADVYTMLKECNMDQNEACRRLKMIQDIRVVASKYSADDVYTMLKECNIDPSEAAQRLLYIDTFQEVKKKKDMQQKSVGKWHNQWRGTSWGNFYPPKVYNDAGRRNLTSGKEYVATNNHVKKVWRPTLPVDSRKESNGTHMATSAAYVNGKLAISNGSHSHKLVPKVSSVTASKNTIASAINTHSASNELKRSSPKLDVMQKKLPVSSCQSVIIPDHLHVPENCKSEFVFGSLAATRPTKPSLSCTAKSGQAT